MDQIIDNSKAQEVKIEPLFTKVFFTFLLINFVIGMGLQMQSSTLALFLDEEGYDEHETGMVFGIFIITAIIARFSTNALASRFGALRMMRYGFLMTAVASLFFLIHQHLSIYLCARLLMGAGVGVTSTLIMAMASQKIPSTRMGQGLGYLGLGTTTAMAFGPFIGISIAWELGFWVLFTCASACYLIAFTVSWNIPHISLPPAPPKLEDRRFETVIDRAVLLPAIMMLFFSAAMSSITCYMSIFSEDYFLPSAGIFFLVSTVGTFISRLFAGKIFDKKGHPFVFIPAITLHLFAMLSIYSIPQNPLNIITAFLNGLGNGALFPAIQTMIITSVPKSKRTIASAYFLVALDLGFGLGAFIMGSIADYYDTFRVVYLVAFWIFIALFIYYLIFYLIPYIRGKRHVLESPKST